MGDWLPGGERAVRGMLLGWSRAQHGRILAARRQCRSLQLLVRGWNDLAVRRLHAWPVRQLCPGHGALRLSRGAVTSGGPRANREIHEMSCVSEPACEVCGVLSLYMDRR